VRAEIEPRAERGELARARISDVEVGYSARSVEEWDQLTEALDLVELLETTSERVVPAGSID